jgi:hypothetical protein
MFAKVRSMNTLVRLCCAALVLSAAPVAAASPPQVLPLWQGKAPGANYWSKNEAVTRESGGRQRVTDVSVPTLTVYLPERSKATGTAVIIAPGGGMRVLSIDDYAQSSAKYFNDRGIAAFVLKYRLYPTTGPNYNATPPRMTEFPTGNANPLPDDPVMSDVIRMAVSDGQRALTMVRGNAARWGIDPKKVGMLGYSAGGGVAFGTAVTPGGGERPDFLISAFGPSLLDVVVPSNPPPLFMAVMQFHPNIPAALMSVQRIWTDAKGSAELHIYDQARAKPGEAGFGLPADWLDTAYTWMIHHGFAPGATGSTAAIRK